MSVRRGHSTLLSAVALLATLAPLGVAPRFLFVGLCVTSTLGQLLALFFPGALPPVIVLSLANLALFVYGTWALIRAKEAPVLFENPLDWPDARRAERTIASVTREGG